MKPLLAVLVPSVTIAMCAGGLISPTHAASLHQDQTRYALMGKISRVVVDDEIGDVTVKTGKTHSVTTVERWDRKKPHVSVSTKGGVVTVKASCPSSGLVDGVVVGDNNCSVDVVVVVPATSDVKVDAQVGSVMARDMSGSERLSTSIGDVRATHAAGSAVSATTDVGDIDISVPAGAYDYRAHTDQGDVSVHGLTYRADGAKSIRATDSQGDISIAGY